MWKKKDKGRYLNRRIKGQVALETAFVFTTLLFLTFSIVNLGILLHTKMIATYAAFMAGRSYQVLGDETGAEKFDEVGQNGQKPKEYLSDLKSVAALIAAEDIFTCSLPWMKVPDGDASFTGPSLDGTNSRCAEGKREYKKTNIGKTLRFIPFTQDQASLGTKTLDQVKGGYTEKGRGPMQYGILDLKYRTPLLIDPMGIISALAPDNLDREDVFVPIILNPGLETGLKANDGGSNKKFDEDFK